MLYSVDELSVHKTSLELGPTSSSLLFSAWQDVQPLILRARKKIASYRAEGHQGPNHTAFFFLFSSCYRPPMHTICRLNSAELFLFNPCFISFFYSSLYVCLYVCVNILGEQICNPHRLFTRAIMCEFFIIFEFRGLLTINCTENCCLNFLKY